MRVDIDGEQLMFTSSQASQMKSFPVQWRQVNTNWEKIKVVIPIKLRHDDYLKVISFWRDQLSQKSNMQLACLLLSCPLTVVISYKQINNIYFKPCLEYSQAISWPIWLCNMQKTTIRSFWLVVVLSRNSNGRVNACLSILLLFPLLLVFVIVFSFGRLEWNNDDDDDNDNGVGDGDRGDAGD